MSPLLDIFSPYVFISVRFCPVTKILGRKKVLVVSSVPSHGPLLFVESGTRKELFLLNWFRCRLDSLVPTTPVSSPPTTFSQKQTLPHGSPLRSDASSRLLWPRPETDERKFRTERTV